MPRYSISQATSTIARLRRHGRVPTEEEVTEAYRDLQAAKIERIITRGPVLDVERSDYLVGLLQARTVVPA